MSKKRTRTQTRELPELNDMRFEFLKLYRRLERKYGRAPSYGELGEARGTSKAAAQQVATWLEERGLVQKPRQIVVGGGTTELGLELLSRSRRRK